MKRFPCLLAGGMLASLLGACTVLVPDSPEPAPTAQVTPERLVELTADCPPPGAVEKPRALASGTDAQVAANLLAAVADWANAGSLMITSEPEWMDTGLPEHCLDDLARAIGLLQASVLLAPGGDATLSVFRDEMVRQNVANLRLAHREGGATNQRLELVIVQQSSISPDGAFLNLVVRNVESGSIQRADHQEWMAIIAPNGVENFVFHLERKDVAHGSFSW